MPLRTMHGDVSTTSSSHAPHGSQRDFRFVALGLAGLGLAVGASGCAASTSFHVAEERRKKVPHMLHALYVRVASREREKRVRTYMSKVKRTEKRGYGKGTRGLCVFPDCTHLVIALIHDLQRSSFLLRSCVQALNYYNYTKRFVHIHVAVAKVCVHGATRVVQY